MTFATPKQFTGVTNVTGIASGNFNGQTDIAVAGTAPSAQVPVVGVYLNNNGNFGTPTLFPFSGTSAGIAVGDFTGNGKSDVAVVDSSTNTLDVFLGDGAGNFTPGAGGALGGSSGDSAIVSADFSGNGQDDVAVLDPAANDVVIATSGAFGAFSVGSSFAVPDPTAIVVADFNHDNHPDLAIASGNGQVYIALNNGSGVFSSATPYNFASQITPVTSLAVADFNGDSLPDIVGLGTGPTGPLAGVLLNAGGGAFTAGATLAVQADAQFVTTGDFSQTGNQDVAVLGSGGSLEIIPGDGTGQFGSAVSVFTNQLGSPTVQALAGNFNADSAPDIAYLSGTSAGGCGLTLNTTGVQAGTGTLTPAVAKSTLPAQAVGGAAVHGTATVDVTNSTAATVKGKLTVTLYASTDGAVDSSSVSLGSAKAIVSLKANGTAPVSVPLKLPTNLSAGTYTLLAQTIDPSGNLTTAATGPSLTVAAPFISLSESFSKLSLPASVVSGAKTPAVASLRITNSGNIASSGMTTISLLASPDAMASDGTAINTIKRSLLIGVGKSVVVPVPLVAYPNVADGTYSIVAQVTDPDANVTSAASAATVNIAAAYIDLADSVLTAPATGTVGKPLGVAFLITNNGNISAVGSLDTLFETSASADGSNPFQLATLLAHINLLPGASKTLHFSVPIAVGSPGGQQYLVAYIDPANAFNDSNLANNLTVSAMFTNLS